MCVHIMSSFLERIKISNKTEQRLTSSAIAELIYCLHSVLVYFVYQFFIFFIPGVPLLQAVNISFHYTTSRLSGRTRYTVRALRSWRLVWVDMAATDLGRRQVQPFVRRRREAAYRLRSATWHTISSPAVEPILVEQMWNLISIWVNSLWQANLGVFC
jgi:hypothetical protein